MSGIGLLPFLYLLFSLFPLRLKWDFDKTLHFKYQNLPNRSQSYRVFYHPIGILMCNSWIHYWLQVAWDWGNVFIINFFFFFFSWKKAMIAHFINWNKSIHHKLVIQHFSSFNSFILIFACSFADVGRL